MLLDPNATTFGDLLLEALREAGVVGVGMQASADYTQRGWARMQWVLQQWARKSLMIFAQQMEVIPCTGGNSYSVGPSGQFSQNAGDFNADFSPDFGPTTSGRPERLSGVFFRQTQGAQAQGPIDYELTQVESGQDYWTKVRMKGLVSWPRFWYYEPSLPNGTLYVYPVPQASQGYELGVVLRRQVDLRIATLATVVVLPPEYHYALVLATAMALRSAFMIPGFPGDSLPTMYRQAMKVIEKSNVRVGRLSLPESLTRRGGRYNIFSDDYGG